MREYLEKLNDAQLAPVTDTEGAVLVIAGAGSGKTRVLTSRITHLILDKNVKPYNILAITFTNKASSEMKERLEYMVGSLDGMWVLTIHAMCVRILRKFIEKLGYTTNFSIYSESDKEHVLKRVVAQMDEADPDKLYKQAKFYISNCKCKGQNPDDFESSIDAPRDADKIAKAYRMYEDSLKSSNSLDFDDLLLKTYKLLTTSKEALEYYNDKFHYIHIDEFQDTNEVQYNIIKLLAKNRKNIFAVGDDDQGIYGWRGAELSNILYFHKQFKDAKVYKLEQNYRSSKAILDLANKIIKNNRTRRNKVLWTENPNGTAVRCYLAKDDSDEAQKTALDIKNLISRGVNPKQIAVLMRVNAISRKYEQEFNKYGIPFRLYGGFKFFERKEIKDLLAYMKILTNPLDNEGILRIINVPKRGIGQKSIDELLRYAEQNNCSVFDSVFGCDNLELGESAKAKIRSFKGIIKALALKRELVDLKDLLGEILDITNYLTIFEGNTEENDVKKMNISELQNSINEFCKDNQGADLNDFLNSVTLSSDTDEIADGNFATIATIHAVKGLEFDAVFVAGLDSNVFPLSRAMDDPKELEEERRLMYVAITRARKMLTITRAKERFLYGRLQASTPSMFIQELSPELDSLNNNPYDRSRDDWSSGFDYSSYNGYTNNKSGYNNNSGYTKRQSIQENDYGYVPDVVPGSTTGFKISTKKVDSFSSNKGRAVEKKGNFDIYKEGGRLSHPKFGQGTIISKKVTGSGTILTVAFIGIGIKELIAEYAPIKPI